ncbi:MAG: hypothetical protein ACE5GB_03410 [Acidimicrobiales bacterium]
MSEVDRVERLHALEVEVARLTAELEEARGADPVQSTSRFLTLAAATIDQAMDDVRGEVERASARASAQAQERAAEAERRAAEAQAEAESARAAAAQVTIAARRELEEAMTEAERLLRDARVEAGSVLVVERERVGREVEALAGVRAALVAERRSLETYHDELRARVQGLAEAMVSFMSSERDPDALEALQNLALPEIESAAAALERDDHDQQDSDDVVDDDSELAPVASLMPVISPEVTTDPAETAAGGETTEAAADPDETEMADGLELLTLDDAEPAPSISSEPTTERPVVEPVSSGGWEPVGVGFAAFDDDDISEATIVEEAPEEDPWRQPEPTEGPVTARPMFGGPIQGSVLAAARSEADSDLFAPARPGEGEVVGSTLGELFARGGDKLVQHAETNVLRDAIEDTTSRSDERFQEFIDGDDDEDVSRSWFLRDDKS